MGEITIDEILERGIKLPEDRFSFPVEEFEKHMDDLQLVGGIYVFTHEAGNCLYVGVTSNLKTRLMAHVRGRGNRELGVLIGDRTNVDITIYKEANLSLRELYENILILANNPEFNTMKKSRKIEGTTIRKYTKKLQQDVVEMYSDNIPRKQILTSLGISGGTYNYIVSQNFKNKTNPTHGVTREMKTKTKQKELEKRRDILDRRNEKIISKFLKGDKTQIQIAKDMSVTLAVVEQVIRRYRKKHGVTLDRLTENEISIRNADILACYREGLSTKQISEMFNLTENHIQGIRRRNRSKEVSK